ncbi:peptide ABC transporter permease [Rhizocola hellebori]|uniref:Peptide ABC transporter permease n=1 Tax=Rhizocola hellebori TaxID=1392758 RepID=A0A8J3Q791_9ACTN|nr:ABC transporter permease [Rhizocola hellebori]GIH04400.1 peptide ABC transporter permease [Rhizocola hellebori]
MSDPVTTATSDNPAVIPVQAGPGVNPQGPTQERAASLWSDARRELIRNPIFLASVSFILIVSSMAILPSMWTSKNPRDCDIKFAKLSPSAEHWFGTNVLGCDYYSHAIYGARPSLSIALIATTGVTLIGVVLGMLAGFFGGWVDTLISRIIDMIYSLPFLLGALVILGVLRQSDLLHSDQWWPPVLVVAIVLIILGWVGVARIMRGSVLSAKNLDYVLAAKSLGASNSRLMFRHILPNAIAPVVVVATISLGGYIGAEATLTFLGAGLQPPAVSWGTMIAGNIDYFNEYKYLVLIPCGLLVPTVLSFILAGDALRDALDPKLR